jgi:glycosyltransferase involved in cell wall biosynthesis
VLDEKHITIVIPVYNGEKTLENVVNRIPKNVADKIIILDDGSKDNSLNIARMLSSRSNIIQVLQHKTNRGYGGAQKTLFNAALKEKTDIVVLLHQDGQYAPEDISKLVQPLLEDTSIDLVIGVRQNMLEGGMPLIKYVGNRILTFLENLILGLRLGEYHSGFRAYTTKALKKIDFNSCTDDLHFDTEILIEAVDKKLKLIEVPVPTYYGPEVSQTWRIWSYGFNCLKSVLVYRFLKLIRNIEKFLGVE